MLLGFSFFFLDFGSMASFSASWLLGFLASCWFMRLLGAFWLWLFASSAFPVLLRQVAFWLCGFLLVYVALGGFGFSPPLLSQLLSDCGCGFPHT